MSSLNETPRSDRLHIGIFGKRNSGKSSLVNALTGQEAALVSQVPGTTTDPVYKPMEIHGIGPVVFIDTAGFDDEGELGEQRVKKTKEALEKTDIALMVLSGDDMEQELKWTEQLKKNHTPVLLIMNKCDLIPDCKRLINRAEKLFQQTPIAVSAKEKTGIDEIRAELIRKLPEDYDAKSITEGVVQPGDTVLLIMPQDIQAPKGRLILPQVQTIRDLLDKKCVVMSCTADKMEEALAALAAPPDVIITDSQVFKAVYEKKPEKSRLTSFSVLFAAHKGDITYYRESASAIDNLTENSRVLIAEACTHAPLSEDIGRVKIPRLLRKRVGEKLTIDLAAGQDFPEDLTSYDLVIQCGACMFNRKYVLSRIEKARSQNVPMSNYGVVIAYLNGILDKIG
ncbi:[FeFe] hydrogenase H-cluster maturation GTPase HydF [Clostridium sp. MCC353]|uniref:[FeFe] hydrogenase H-cluster maturation GTPase HydF n=1 Tax=Clostridium sp. MCC353 TaxID=2592646 RepID=UPI001C027F7A|nr:[FeFe] hydrogenase H-cluster maturation GTPase HydF [Clostridium sp. MCC353]MBT9779803.1 [FeFe] hydrogenase H-cluster maturation GTPase HydF [Clostridium sp. MCC353]